ncbi:MAG: LytTR family transcriptional regulator, partial [Alphaproteobacteria bacterium]
MFMLGPIGFTAPWILAALAALPILWLLLRAVPPAPIRRRFPGVALLLGLTDDDSETDRTPWWLLLLRTLAVAALILGFAGPVLNPQERTPGSGPLLILADASWASARDWPGRIDRIAAALEEAGRDGRPVAVVMLTDLPPGPPAFQAAGDWEPRLASLAPKPWEPDMEAAAAWAEALQGSFETFWLSDGLAREGRDTLLAALEARGTVRVFEDPRPVLALRPPA